MPAPDTPPSPSASSLSSPPPASAHGDDFRVGVMMMDVEGKDSPGFRALVERATARLARLLEREHRLAVEVMAFAGPHLTPDAGGYAPLDFFEIGFAEKTERHIPFLLIVTEVDLAASSLSYTLAMTSRLTNIALVSAKRLDPEFWGGAQDEERAVQRLTRLLAHAFGHLVNLAPTRERSNLMYEVETVEDLDAMTGLDEAQWAAIAAALPREAHERRTRTGRGRFVLATLLRDAPEIARGIWQANPLRLLARLPTMIAAALSVIIVLLFSAETWDVAKAVSLGQVALFSGISLAAALYLLYRAFALDAVMTRERALTETTVVTVAVTALSLGLTLLLLYAAFGLLMYLAIVTVFPAPLMESWPTVGAATEAIDHLKLSAFLAAMGVLAGSLGGRSDSRKLVRSVLFTDGER
ncbi:hypothetical protein [Sphingomicrobium astaxanthinifaciens]|uniref:hypothetical protein n=1 Tax=Sphingomicrobium astaxanthinifaciens TaxID=1227949 RepID=UPI001FCA72A5|nr:hypothetical protein [Sphingomicrobium astaxanthinifaciens]MCJ7421259.1 hypothetical protein [Sphingomicrobium astaxanthinifaciens]